ncbi:MAG: indole-3-glycerol phosphate synthase TrpC [Gemmatimonadetes bacterium]|nr:indole-3-glycerol phosphate synthase TrpC [Gemmatimonadota bacterium]
MLADIVRTKTAELAELRPRAKELERAAEVAEPPRDFAGALARPDHVALIAECKRRSPGAGEIRPGLDPAALTKGYARAGAAALSVLTDRDYFGGSLADLAAAKGGTPVPVLRKDFTLDPLHVLEARAAGADAVLLIVRILSDRMLSALHAEANALGMAVLVEVHDRAELARALELDPEIVGINNRDLATFKTDLGTTLELLEDVPDDVLVVSESGIRGSDDVLRLGDHGVDAVLVGETLLRAPDPELAAREIATVPRRERVRG